MRITSRLLQDRRYRRSLALGRSKQSECYEFFYQLKSDVINKDCSPICHEIKRHRVLQTNRIDRDVCPTGIILILDEIPQHGRVLERGLALRHKVHKGRDVMFAWDGKRVHDGVVHRVVQHRVERVGALVHGWYGYVGFHNFADREHARCLCELLPKGDVDVFGG